MYCLSRVFPDNAVLFVSSAVTLAGAEIVGAIFRESKPSSIIISSRRQCPSYTSGVETISSTSLNSVFFRTPPPSRIMLPFLQDFCCWQSRAASSMSLPLLLLTSSKELPPYSLFSYGPVQVTFLRNIEMVLSHFFSF
jgi:hypothetical protein